MNILLFYRKRKRRNKCRVYTTWRFWPLCACFVPGRTDGKGVTLADLTSYYRGRDGKRQTAEVGLGGNWEDVQRFLFWSNFLSGAAGYTYGANGVWSFETEKIPFGASPHGGCWNTVPWKTALAYPGGRQMGIGKRILEQYPWWECRPHPEWVEPAATADNCWAPYCAGIPDRLRIIYFPTLISNWTTRPRVKGLEPEAVYRAHCFDPRTGRKYELGRVKGDAQGGWMAPVLPVLQDLVLVLINSRVAKSS